MRAFKHVLTAFACVFAGAAAAEVSGAPKGDQAAPAAKDGAQSSEVPNAYKLNMMIRTTIIALNQANATGNYSVLRDLAAPGFQARNNPAKLGEVFAALRGRNLDLSPVVFIDPKLVRPPAVLPNGLLRLSGFFPSRPEQVNFDLAFQNVDGAWRLFGIAVETSPAAVAANGASGDAPAAETAIAAPGDKETAPQKTETPAAQPSVVKEQGKAAEGTAGTSKTAAKPAAKKPETGAVKEKKTDGKAAGGGKDGSKSGDAAKPSGWKANASKTETPSDETGNALVNAELPKGETKGKSSEPPAENAATGDDAGSWLNKALGSPF